MIHCEQTVTEEEKGGHERVSRVSDWEGFSSAAQQQREALGSERLPTVGLLQQQWKKSLRVWRASFSYQTQESTVWCDVPLSFSDLDIVNTANNFQSITHGGGKTTAWLRRIFWAKVQMQAPSEEVA